MFQQQDLSFIHKYFMGEKQESFLFILIGITGIVCAIVFFFFIKTNAPFYKGLAIPALVIGVLMAIVGYTVYVRSDKQAKNIAYNIGMDASNYIKQTEKPRMQKVMKRFEIYKWIEIALLLTGIAIFFYSKNKLPKELLKGIGLSLAIMAVIALTADFFAQKRGKQYLQKTNELTNIKE